MKKTYGFLQGLIAVLLCASITPFMFTACKGSDEKKLANITLDWVNGVDLRKIAAKYFSCNDFGELGFADARWTHENE